MSSIKPFRGYLPPSDMANKISSPPYDVLSSEEARKMVKNNANSFLRIIKPEIDYKPGHVAHGDTIHRHAAKNIQDFISSGKLQQDKINCFYLYKITMGTHSQTGVMAAVSVAEYNAGLIKKHEFTRKEKEDDRTRHIKITNANTGPIFLKYCIDNYPNSNITLLDSKYFYPIDWRTKKGQYYRRNIPENPSKEFPESYFITYWSQSWGK